MTEPGDKSAMRREMREQRDAFVAGLNAAEAALTFSRAPRPLADMFSPGRAVAAYVAIGSEADPEKLLLAAHEAGCVTALPHVISKISPMRFLRWSPGDALFDGPFGLQQPDAASEAVSPDVVLVPLVAFDESLNRLGQGAGHYDRALSLLENAAKVGVAWSMQQVPFLMPDPWDIPLDAVLTERYWLTS